MASIEKRIRSLERSVRERKTIPEVIVFVEHDMTKAGQGRPTGNEFPFRVAPFNRSAKEGRNSDDNTDDMDHRRSF